MLLAVRFLVAALTEVSTLTPGVQAALHEAVKRRWERRPGEQMSIADLVEVLATISTPDALVPMSLLRPYMRGGLFEGFFDRPRALLSTDFPAGEWWNFDLSTLREENKGIVHGVLAWFMYHVVTVGKKPLDICIDEGWRLLRSGPFTDLLDELGRRARKRGTGVMLLTHLPQDLGEGVHFPQHGIGGVCRETQPGRSLWILSSYGDAGSGGSAACRRSVPIAAARFYGGSIRRPRCSV